MVDSQLTSARPSLPRASLARLFALDILRERTGRTLRIWAFPYIAPVVNLDLVIYFAYLIHGRDGAHYLPVFIAVTGVFSGVLFLAYFLHDTADVLAKTSVLPLSAATRFLYAWLNTARKPALMLVYVVDIFFLISLTHDSLARVFIAQGFLFLLFIDVQLLLVAALIRPGQFPARGAAFLAVALAFSFVEVAAFFHFDRMLMLFPVFGWAAAGINASADGLTATVAAAYAGLIALGAVLTVIGLRRAS